MKIESLSELQKLINLCQKTGVRSIKIDGIELDLGATPLKVPKSGTKVALEPSIFDPGHITPGFLMATQPQPEPEELTDEQLLFYSSDAGINQ